MSRILVLSKRMVKVCAVLVLVLLGLICLLFGRPVSGGLLLGIGILNEVVRKEMQRELRPFEPGSLVRNVDYLIIGELCRTENIVPEGSKFLQLKIPGCSLDAAYEVLRHSFSILKENGGVAVLAYKNKSCSAHEHSLFDVNFLIPLTIQRLHLERYKIMKYFPLPFSPWKSLRLLLNISPAGGV